jgi:MFS family permease
MMGTGQPFELLHPTRRNSLILYADNIIDNIYRMTQGAFVLIGGRFGDVFGHKNILLGGGIWWIIWSLVSGFAKSIVILSLFRGLTGIGAAFIVTNSVALLMHTFPPGRLRNIAMGLFGAMAPIGAAGGSVFSAILVQLTPWKWIFFFL